MNKNLKKFLKGYFSHLTLLIGATVTTIVNVKHTSLLHLTHNDFTLIANTVYAAVITNLKKVQEPILDSYLKRKYPGLGIVIADLEASKSVASKPNTPIPGDSLPASL